MTKARRVMMGWLVILLAGAAGWAAAQRDYPARPIRIVVAYPPGGSNDFLARLYGPKLTERFARQVVVDNRGGGNTIIGSDIVAKSAPDGYTLLLGGSATVAIPHLYRNMPYDTLRDFTPVAGIARGEFLLVVHPALPVHTVSDLIALAREKPGALNYATSSTGGPTHLGAVHFEMLTGVKMQQIGYKGGGPAMADLIGGQVQLAFANPASVMPMVRANRVRAIAVTGEKRLQALPQVPTFEQAGVRGLALRNWYGVIGPAGIDSVIVQKLAAAIEAIAAVPEVRAAIARQGLEGAYMSTAQLDKLRREDWAMAAKLIRAANIKIQN